MVKGSKKRPRDYEDEPIYCKTKITLLPIFTLCLGDIRVDPDGSDLR